MDQSGTWIYYEPHDTYSCSGLKILTFLNSYKFYVCLFDVTQHEDNLKNNEIYRSVSELWVKVYF